MFKFLGFIIVIFWLFESYLAIFGIHKIIIKNRLIASNEICVTFPDNIFAWRYYDKHWKAKEKYGIKYCPSEDFPEGVKAGEVGQISF